MAPQVLVGPGYTDVSAKHLVRTAADRLYLAVSTCDAYPCDSPAQTLRLYRATSSGLPAAFTRPAPAGEPSGVAGWAVALDATDTLHLAWTARTSAGSALAALKYTTFNTTTDTWSPTVETLVASALTDSIGQGVQTVALALDAASVPHLVSLQGSGPGRRLVYRHRTGGVWSAPVQLDTAVTYTGNQRAWHPNLAFDPQGRVVAAWLRGAFNGDNDGTIFTCVRQLDGSWAAPVAVSPVGGARTTIDQSTSLLITPNGRIHTTYLSQPSDYIRYAYSNDAGASWTHNNPGGGTQATHNPSLGPDGAGGLRIYGHGTPQGSPDGHGDDLYFFAGPGGAAGWGGWTLYTTGALDSSVSTRWAQYHHHWPGTVDIAYWANPYPNQVYVGVEVLGTSPPPTAP